MVIGLDQGGHHLTLVEFRMRQAPQHGHALSSREQIQAHAPENRKWLAL